MSSRKPMSTASHLDSFLCESWLATRLPQITMNETMGRLRRGRPAVELAEQVANQCGIDQRGAVVDSNRHDRYRRGSIRFAVGRARYRGALAGVRPKPARRWPG